MKYLLDADWVIHALAGRSDVIRSLEELSGDGIAISLITVGEIYEGAFLFPDPLVQLQMYREFLTPFALLSLSDEIMERFAQIRARLRQQGDIIPDFDILLGSTALQFDLTILTLNIKHLSRIPDIKLYKSTPR